MQERPPENPRRTFIHHRGEWLSPEKQVEGGVPSFLPDLPAGAPRNRLTLARWLVSRDNPLTARVTVNRQWAALFGAGIVRTTADFGTQGEPPTHPELLGLARRPFHGRRLVDEAAHAADRHQRHLPAVVAGHAATAGERLREPPAWLAGRGSASTPS